MIDPRRPDLQPDLAQAEGTEAPGVAREQFVHGLLEWLHLDPREERERRMSSLLNALSAETQPRVSWRLRHWRMVSGVAAAIVITTVIMLAVPTQTSAVAVVQESLAASRTAGDRRYEVRVMPPRASKIQAEPIGTLDVRDADHVVIHARTPFGDQITVGRNENGAWAIRPDGTVDRYPPRQAWPNWVNFGQSTVLLVSVDELMTWLGKSYNLRRSESAPVPGSQGAPCDRITAEHKPGQTPEPPRVELWVDPKTHVVRRMELHWLPRPEPAGVEGNDPGDGPDGPPEARPDRIPDDRLDGPPDQRPPRDRRPLRDGPPGGPLGPNAGGPPDQGPGFRPGPRPDRMDPQGPPPRRPPDGGPRRRPPHPRPEFLGGPPDFNGGRHPPPPKMIVFDLVEGASFEASWFEPAAHAAPPDPSPDPN